MAAPYSPDWTVIGSYTHAFNLGRGTLDATVGARYESAWFSNYDHALGTEQEATTKFDASLTYDSGSNWQIGVWGKNLSNEEVLAATAGGGFPGPASGYLEAPRTYGVRFTVQY